MSDQIHHLSSYKYPLLSQGAGRVVRVPFVLLKGHRRLLRFFTYLKIYHSVNIERNISKFSEDTGMSPRTIRKLLDELSALGWIRTKGEGRSCRIWTLKWEEIVGKDKYRGFYVKPIDVLCHNRFMAKAFCGTAAYMKLIHPDLSSDQKPMKRPKEGKSKIFSEEMHVRNHLGGISCSLLADRLGCSKATAWKYLKLGSELGFIKWNPRWVVREDMSVQEIIWRRIRKEKDIWKYRLENGKVRERITNYFEVVNLSIK